MRSDNNYLHEKSIDSPSNNLIEKYIFIPISIILTIIPLIVRSKIVKLDKEGAMIYGISTMQTDLFSQVKFWGLFVGSIVLLIILILYFQFIFKKKDKIVNIILIGAAVFWGFTFLSALFSKYKLFSFWGTYNRAEGLITVTCYMLLLVYSIYTFKHISDYKYLLIPVLILVVGESIWGVFQYLGHDLLNTSIGSFIASGVFDKKFALSYPKGKIYGTLFHYDYMGSFVGIVLPLLAVLTVFEKKLIYKIILGIASLLSLWLLLGSTSRAGLVGIFFSFIFTIILFGKSLLKKWKPISIGFAAILILVVGINFATKGSVFERLPSMFSDVSTIFQNTTDDDSSKSNPFKDIKYVDGHSEIVLQNETLKIYNENNTYVFKNSNDQVINYTFNGQTFTTDDADFKDISFSYVQNPNKKTNSITLNFNSKKVFTFTIDHNNSVHLIDPYLNKDIDIEHPDVTQFFVGKEKLGSSRGYIWSRSIPLIKNNLILGSGPDTFVYQFPQYDYIGKYYAYDTPDMIVDKPHNLYLQIALDYGVIALIAFLCIILVYIFDCIKLYAFKGHYSHSQIIAIANFLGIIGYLFAGFFNDSIISVAPIFWIVLGVGIAINFINRSNPYTN